MNDQLGISSLLKQASALLPDGMSNLREDFEESLRPLIERKMQEYDLVSRQEFQQQQALLESLEEKMSALESKLHELK